MRDKLMAKYSPSVKFDTQWILRLSQLFKDYGMQEVQKIGSREPKPEMFGF